MGKRSTHAQFNPKSTATCTLFGSCVADRSAMSTKVPYLSRLGIYRISIEKQETLLKLMALSTAAILCEEHVDY